MGNDQSSKPKENKPSRDEMRQLHNQRAQAQWQQCHQTSRPSPSSYTLSATTTSHLTNTGQAPRVEPMAPKCAPSATYIGQAPRVEQMAHKCVPSATYTGQAPRVEPMAHKCVPSATNTGQAPRVEPMAPKCVPSAPMLPISTTTNVEKLQTQTQSQPLYPKLDQPRGEVHYPEYLSSMNKPGPSGTAQSSSAAAQATSSFSADDFVFVSPRAVPSAPSPFKKEPAAPRPRSRGRSASGNRASSSKLDCPTCSNQFGVNIFQCRNGHSSCERCQLRGSSCGLCSNPITTMRNFALQAYVADCRAPCPNASEGCRLNFKIGDMESHTRECPFQDIECPLTAIFGRCSWKGKLSKIGSHFDEKHPENRQGAVGQEMVLPSIYYDDRFMHLVKIGPYNFFVHLQVSETERKVFMTVQLLGTKTSAAKWMYELHVFNKREPRRKYQYTDVCHSIGTPIKEIVNESKCAILPLPYAMTYINEGSLMYKFYIKKDSETKEFANRVRGRGGRGRRNNFKARDQSQS